MALIVTVNRGADKHDLGSFDELELSRNHIGHPGSREPLASHVHHRWTVPGGEHSYTSLEIVGPLWVQGPRAQKLGPYLTFSMNNGVLYVDRRIFGIFDAQNDDWYMTDIGEHWKAFRLQFQPNP